MSGNQPWKGVFDSSNKKPNPDIPSPEQPSPLSQAADHSAEESLAGVHTTILTIDNKMDGVELIIKVDIEDIP